MTGSASNRRRRSAEARAELHRSASNTHEWPVSQRSGWYL